MSASPRSLRRTVGEAAWRARYHARITANPHPAVFLPLARRFSSLGERLVGDDTDIVIEGPPRCANTFAVTAFQVAQPGSVVVAHHAHAPAQVREGIRRGLPVLVLIRPPRDAMLSVMSRAPVSPRLGARIYLTFYEHVLSFADRFVTADFGSVVDDFGAVIRRVNERFGTAFAEFEHTDENVRRCFELIERKNARLFGALKESAVARPSASREAARAALEGRLQDPSVASLVSGAEALYSELAARTSA